MQSGNLKAKLFWITLFCIAIGYLESAVVIYLRELYYPSGFRFPLSWMPANISLTEILRELSTLLILLSIAHLSGQNRKQRTAWFFYSFAMWDLFYYVFLKLLIHWPESWFTWDILFLIPTTWTGPVIAPILVSFTMIILAALLLLIDAKYPLFMMRRGAIFILILGAGIIFLSFIWDYSAFMLSHCTVSELFDMQKVQQALQHYIPVKFNWWLFMLGLLIVYYGLYQLFKASKISFRHP